MTATTGAAPSRAVSMKGITKTFGSVVAADDVSLDVHEGTVLGLLGENGAGKTTLMNVLCGVYLPDSGEVSVFDRPLSLGSPKDALEAGVGMVHQHLRLVETLTGAENISLAIDRGRWLRRREPPEHVIRMKQDLGFSFELSSKVWQLPLASRQQLEILRVLSSGARVLVLDEPTSVLAPLETRKLFEIVRRVAAAGCAVVLISHKLREVLDVADSVAVMRAGRIVHEAKASGMEVAELARLMVGDRTIPATERPRTGVGDVVLSVESLCVNNDLDQEVVHDVSFEVCRGELVTIIGVAGNGQEELMEAVGGLRPRTSGRIEVRLPSNGAGKDFSHIPAERLGVGLAPGLSLEDNAVLGTHRRPPFRSWLRHRDVRAHAGRILERFRIGHPGRGPVRRLSGGNLQRVVLGRELLETHDLIIASYPTRGLDVATAAQVRTALVEAVKPGRAALVCSEELDESLALATRVLVVYGGRIVADLRPGEWSAQRVGRLMTMGTEA